ncbi:MAG: gamma-glutamyltransferase [Pseudonocardiales bacterium]|nr:gamma-glutamyltransferase [Pseudonocardiales bacterium]
MDPTVRRGARENPPHRQCRGHGLHRRHPPLRRPTIRRPAHHPAPGGHPGPRGRRRCPGPHHPPDPDPHPRRPPPRSPPAWTGSATGSAAHPSATHRVVPRWHPNHRPTRPSRTATPSGGWLQSSPAIPGLGFCLGTRAQMFWLEPGLPSSLVPGRRPRTTLSPSLALRDAQPSLAFGTPGGDQQDAWQLCFWLAHTVGHTNLQAAIDAPVWHTTAFPGSFNPRYWQPGEVVVESRLGEPIMDELTARGHLVVDAGPWSLGRVSAVARDPLSGLLRAGANARGMQGYAVGR